MFLSRFDVESSGKIDVDEMRFVLKNLPVKVMIEVRVSIIF